MKTFISGNYINQGTYKCFQPSKINQEWTIDDPEVLNLLSQADRQLGKLDMYAENIPNIDYFINMHVLKEAIHSSKIEGIQTNFEDAFLDKEDVNDEKRDDWEEVQNYIVALNHAILSLNKIPFSSKLIRETHKVLLQSERGKQKLPGEYRSCQNWIGGATFDDAIFIPPLHTSIDEYMVDLENFIRNTESFYPDLLKIALIHYQFDTIHPFLVANGRVGRMMITMNFVEKGILKKPILYLSDFFERNRMLYHDNLTRARVKCDLKQWFKFFLVGIIETAKNGINTFDNILQLQNEVETKLQSLGVRSHNAQLILNHLYQRPIVDAQKVKNLTGLSSPSSYKLIEELENLDILNEITGSKRGKIYLFKAYINLFT